MTITHELGPNALALLTRLLDFVEGKQQAQITAEVSRITKALQDSGDGLAHSIDANK